MTIQIDDAGWGSMIGGVLIACYRVETAEFTAWEIPVTDFQGESFNHRRYLSSAWVATQRGLQTLKWGVPEPVQICSGFVHGETHHKLRAAQIVKITGPLQDKIEAELLSYLHKLGFPFEGSTEEYGKLFFESVRWLKGGNPNRRGMDPERLKVAKSGWKTFRFYQQYPYREATEKAKAFKRQHRFGH